MEISAGRNFRKCKHAKTIFTGTKFREWQSEIGLAVQDLQKRDLMEKQVKVYNISREIIASKKDKIYNGPQDILF